MKKTLALLAALTIFLNLETVIYAEGQQPKTAETDQVIVIMEEDATVPLKNGKVIPVEGEENQLVSVEIPKGETIDGFIQELEKRSDVKSVEPDHLIKLAYTTNDPAINFEQYHHKRIGTIRAWDQTLGSPNVVVAVIDDGADLLHPDLAGKWVSPYDIVKDSATAIPAGSHGTHIAGIIGASIGNRTMGAGVAPKTSIMPINVFNGQYSLTSDIIAGISYAVKNEADIINMSFATEVYSEAFETAVKTANENGVVLVAAAGNDGKSTPNYPAAYPGVISVGSTTSTDELSTFSNYGSTIDITAPGDSIYSTWPGGLFESMSGTSMATPVVAGVAALVMSNEPELSNKEIEKRLYETAKDLGAPGRDDLFGNGRVNAKDALLLNPAKPGVDRVTDQSTAVKGTAEAEATVTVKAGTALLGTGIVEEDDKFTVAIPKQRAGTKLKVTVADANGKVSEAEGVIVADVTAPHAPIVISLYNTSASITGKAESGSTVHAYAGTKEIGKATAVGGGFTMKIAKQPAGTSVTLVAVDAAGNKSPAAKITVGNATLKVATTAYNKLKVSWSQTAGAHGYEIYRSTSLSGTYSKVGTAASGSTLSYTNSSLTTGKTYYYKVRAYRTIDGKKVYGPYISIASGKPAVSNTASVKAAAGGYNKNKISWSPVSGASGYAVYQATSKNGAYRNIKMIGNGSTLTHTKTGLTAGKTYYYKVRAYRTVNGKKYFGPYSSTASAKPVLPIRSVVKSIGSNSIFSYIHKGLAGGKAYYAQSRTVTGKKYINPYSGPVSSKTASAKPSSISAVKAGSTSIKASWPKVKEASGYELHRATSKTGTYFKIKAYTSGSAIIYTDKSLTKGKTYYYKVRAYRFVNGKKMYSTFTATAAVKL
ncbi:S8 family serine peptidase [Planococcus shixiaomingii]|uniref:S8 family serine peptidase n=1 Tax=Planococcus shixiaomingii TaxID=3058393 RepID=UPI00261B8473|nr:S8 family serine peptidase [Planococcus sp. N022]WKA53940.1 S8 family serine peptidase [Planococcus sp. N022]